MHLSPKDKFFFGFFKRRFFFWRDGEWMLRLHVASVGKSGWQRCSCSKEFLLSDLPDMLITDGKTSLENSLEYVYTMPVSRCLCQHNHQIPHDTDSLRYATGTQCQPGMPTSTSRGQTQDQNYSRGELALHIGTIPEYQKDPNAGSSTYPPIHELIVILRNG